MKKKIISTLLVAVMFVSLMTTVAWADLTTEKTAYVVGDEFTVLYVVPNALNNVGAVQVSIEFNKTVFQVTSIKQNELSGAAAKKCTDLDIANTAGCVIASWIDSENMLAIAANAGILEITFKLIVQPVDEKISSSLLITGDDSSVDVGEKGLADFKPQSGVEDKAIVITQKIPVASILLDATRKELKTGESFTLTATVQPESATYKEVTFTSGDPKVAIVDENGKVTAVGEGTAVITATADGKSSVCTITVEHEHNYSADWKHDNDKHWHECGCKDRAGEAGHSLKLIKAKASSCTEKGNIEHYACSVCKARFEDEAHTKPLSDEQVFLPLAEHEYSSKWTADKTHHWHACTVCADRADEAEHSFGSWAVVESATDKTAGAMSRKCSVCGYTENRVIPIRDNFHPGTGDESNIALYAVLMVLAVVGAVVITRIYCRKQRSMR